MGQARAVAVEFILYVPSGVAGVARRLCADHGIGVNPDLDLTTRWATSRASRRCSREAGGQAGAARAAAAEARRASARTAEAAGFLRREQGETPAAKTPRPEAGPPGGQAGGLEEK